MRNPYALDAWKPYIDTGGHKDWMIAREIGLASYDDQPSSGQQSVLGSFFFSKKKAISTSGIRNSLQRYGWSVLSEISNSSIHLDFNFNTVIM